MRAQTYFIGYGFSFYVLIYLYKHYYLVLIPCVLIRQILILQALLQGVNKTFILLRSTDSNS